MLQFLLQNHPNGSGITRYSGLVYKKSCNKTCYSITALLRCTVAVHSSTAHIKMFVQSFIDINCILVVQKSLLVIVCFLFELILAWEPWKRSTAIIWNQQFISLIFEKYLFFFSLWVDHVPLGGVNTERYCNFYTQSSNRLVKTPSNLLKFSAEKILFFYYNVM